MPISVVDPVGPALEVTKWVCFRPFQIGKWFLIGFCAFVAGFVESGAGFPNPNVSRVGSPSSQDIDQAVDWLRDNLAVVLLVALAVLVVIIGLSALFTWLGSRGQFMFLDNIVRNEGAVVAPWHEYRMEGNSVFWFHFLFGLIGLAAMLLVVGAAFGIAFTDFQARTFGPAATAGVIFGAVGLVLVWLVSIVVNVFLDDFVVPIMYLRRIPVMEAWREFRTSLLRGRVGTFIIYLLFKALLSVFVGLIAGIFALITCCVSWIPYVGTHVLLLPFHVFRRAYPLCFLQQFGPEWQFFGPTDEYGRERFGGEPYEEPEEGYRPPEEHIRPPDDHFRPE